MDGDYNYKTVPKFVFFGTYKCPVKEFVICNIGLMLTAVPLGDKRSMYATHITIPWIEVAEVKICPDQANPVLAIQSTPASVATIRLKMNFGKSDHFCFDPRSHLLGEKLVIVAFQRWEPQAEVWLKRWGVRFSKISVEKANCMIQLVEKQLISGSNIQTEVATASSTAVTNSQDASTSSSSATVCDTPTNSCVIVPKSVYFGTYKCRAKELIISNSDIKLTSVPPNDNQMDCKIDVAIQWIEMALVKICPEPDNPMIAIRPTLESVVKTQEAMDIGKSSSDFRFNPYSNSASEKWLIVALQRWEPKIEYWLKEAKVCYLKIPVDKANRMIKLAKDAFIRKPETTASSTTAATNNSGDSSSSSATVRDTPTNSFIVLRREIRRSKRGNKQLGQEYGRLKEEITSLKQENDKLKREKEESNREKKRLKRGYEQLDQENKKLNQENERLEQENASLKLKQQMIQQLIN